MGKKPRPDDLVDWTVTYAPEAGEALPAPAPAVRLPPRPTTLIPGRLVVHLNWRMALLGLSPLLVALLVVTLSNAWNRRQLERNLSTAVALEERAILSGNLDELRYSTADAAWLEAQMQRAEAMQPAPLPLPSMWASTAPAEVRRVRPTGPNTARADVARVYYAPDGRRAVFVVPQYYHYADNAWVRMAPPAVSAGVVAQWRGYYLDASYYAVDEALVLALTTDLDATLAQACARWSCPAGLRFDLRFLIDDVAPLSRFDFFTPEPSTPWLFHILLSRRDTFEGSLLALLPAPHSAGVPADATSQQVYLSGISLELLARLAAHLSPASRRHNALPYALAARLAAELGLEAATVAATRAGPAVFTADELWHLNFVSTEPPFGPYYTQAAQRQALGLVNGLLADQEPEAASRLFAGLAADRDPIAWVASALGLSPKAAADVVQTALAPAAPEPASLAADQTFTLGCRDGLAGLTPGQTAPPYALVGRLVAPRPLAWSPQGDYLLTLLAGHPSLIEAKTGTVTALPEANGYLAGATWVTDSIAAYTIWPYDALGRRFDPGAFTLHFYNAAQPAQSPAPMPGVLAYVLSPDRTTAAVVLAEANMQWFSRQGKLYLMPALGGSLTLLGAGQAPAWSPDGQRLAYIQSVDQDFQLIIFTTALGRPRLLFEYQNWGTAGGVQDLEAVWSPVGEKLALIARGGQGRLDWTMWMVSAADGEVPWAIHDRARAYPLAPQFSADGDYLTMLTWSPYWPRLIEVLEADTGATVARLPSAGGAAAWAPEGHALAVSSLEGLALVAEPEGGAPTALTREACFAALWN
jgi:hypothetical protein